MIGLLAAAALQAVAAFGPRECPVDLADPASVSRANTFIAALHPVGVQQDACGAYLRSIATGSSTEAIVDEKEMTLPQRFTYVTRSVQSDLADLNNRHTTASRLYDLLSPDQRIILNRITLSSNSYSANAADPVTEPVPVNYGSKSWKEAEWLVKPGDNILSRLYPAKARDKMIKGQVRIQCTIDVDGYAFDCNVLRDLPAGSGFGNAALEATGYMRFSPATFHGIPRETSVVIPLTFLPPPVARGKDSSQ